MIYKEIDMMLTSIRSAFAIVFLILLNSLCCIQHTNAQQRKDAQKIPQQSISPLLQDTTFENLLHQLNQSFESYYTRYESRNLYAVKQFHIPKEEMKYILDTEEEKVSTMDSISSSSLITYLHDRAYQALTDLLSYKGITNHVLTSKMFDHNITVKVAEDRKLYILTFHPVTTGTYQSQESIVHYRINHDTIVNSFDTNLVPSATGNPVFFEDGYDNIQIVPTPKGVKYLLHGKVNIGSYTYSEYIQLVEFVKSKSGKGKFISEFTYSLNSRNPANQISYNQQLKRITVNYLTDEINPECSCAQNKTNTIPQDSSHSDYASYSRLEKAKRHKCSCIFDFNGHTFVAKKR